MLRTDLAREIWQKEYRFGSEEPIETFQRVAKALASVEKDHQDQWADKFLRMMVKFKNDNPVGIKFTPGGRITANAGTTFKKATMINCFSGNTKFITREYGLTDFRSCAGKKITILNKKGWQEAEVKFFGYQPLNKVTFKPAVPQEFFTSTKTGQICKKGSEGSQSKICYIKNGRSNYELVVDVTPDHKWALCSGELTTRLTVGDIVEACVCQSSFSFEDKKYKDGFIHGLVYGDGSERYRYLNSDEARFYIRLCGHKAQYKDLFENVQFFESNEGDPTVFVRTSKNLKSLPDDLDPEYVKGFIDGWASTDGCFKINEKECFEIDSQNEEAMKWLLDYAYLGGYFVRGYCSDSNVETNFGKRNSPLNRVTLSSYDTKWKVVRIEEFGFDEVFCAVVQDEHFFTLAGGLYTSNCFVHGPVTGADVKYTRKSEEGDISYPVHYKTDDNPDDLMNIFLTILEQAKTLSSQGGYGVNFGFIRPRGSLIKGTGIEHPGVLAYMRIWNSVSECIVKGSEDGYADLLKNYIGDEKEFEKIKDTIKKKVRKGAMMGVLSCQHPDIEEFVKAKQKKGELTKFNISVLIDDEFMKAVENDDFYNLHFKGTIYKKIKAKELYDLIMESCYNRGEPGVLFYDNMQKNNPISYLGKLTCANPCGEVTGLTSLTTVCLLGSFNLTQYVEIDGGGNTYFDYDLYKEDIKTATRLLDNVNDLSYGVLPPYEWAINNLRQIGMGLNALGSALAMLMIPYNSPEAVAFVRKLCELKENITWQTSSLLGKEKGAFKVYNKEAFESTEYFKSDRLWPETKEMLRKHGPRNAKTTTNPPLGNASLLCGSVSNGIEPIYQLDTERKVICSQWPEGLDLANVKRHLSEKKGKDFTYWQGNYKSKQYYFEEHNRGLCEINVIRDYGYQWLLDNFSDRDHTAYLITTRDLEVDDHLNIQEVAQYYCNQSISKTINVPKSFPFKKFKEMYIKGWKKGLIGVTAYREGSMEAVLSEISKAETSKEIIKRDIKLPSTFINGDTRIIKKEGKKFYINFSYLPTDNDKSFPICMWIQTNAAYKEKEDLRTCNKAARELAKLAYKSGIDEKIITEAIEKTKEDYPHNRLGRMISLNLRHNVPRESILTAITDIEGDYVSSLLASVRKFLAETIPNGTVLPGYKCLSCGSTNVYIEAGCKKCKDCQIQSCG